MRVTIVERSRKEGGGAGEREREGREASSAREGKNEGEGEGDIALQSAIRNALTSGTSKKNCAAVTSNVTFEEAFAYGDEFVTRAHASRVSSGPSLVRVR